MEFTACKSEVMPEGVLTSFTFGVCDAHRYLCVRYICRPIDVTKQVTHRIF